MVTLPYAHRYCGGKVPIESDGELIQGFRVVSNS
jgi:hypothetical protein